MKTGIIVAMQRELDLLIPLMEEYTLHTLPGGTTIYDGKIEGMEVLVMKCGIGKVNAAFGAAELIRYSRPDLIINTGVAGGTGSEAKVLDVVVGQRVAYHDVWCGPGTVRGTVQGLPTFFEGDSRILALDCLTDVKGVHKGLIASGDCFVDTTEALESIRAIYPDVMAVDMESAPIAHVCHLTGVPFISIRVVSDTPGADEDNSAQYSDFWTAAPGNTFRLLNAILKEIGSKR